QSLVHASELWVYPLGTAGLEQCGGGVVAVGSGDEAAQLCVQIRASRGGESRCEVVHVHVGAGDWLTTPLGVGTVLVQAQVALLEWRRGASRRAALEGELLGEVHVEESGVQIGWEVGRVAGGEDLGSDPI